MLYSVHCVGWKCNQSLLHVRANSLKVDMCVFFSAESWSVLVHEKEDTLYCTILGKRFSVDSDKYIKHSKCNITVSKWTHVSVTRLKLGLCAHRFCWLNRMWQQYFKYAACHNTEIGWRASCPSPRLSSTQICALSLQLQKHQLTWNRSRSVYHSPAPLGQGSN